MWIMYKNRVSVANEGKINFKFVQKCEAVEGYLKRIANKLLERDGSRRTFIQLRVRKDSK